jgi:hypothetical protein
MIKQISAEDTIQLVRGYLREEFPETRFAVRGIIENTYTAIMVRWLGQVDRANELIAGLMYFQGSKVDPGTGKLVPVVAVWNGQKVRFMCDFMIISGVDG